MKKFYLTALLFAGFAASLPACGNNSKDETPGRFSNYEIKTSENLDGRNTDPYPQEFSDGSVSLSILMKQTESDPISEMILQDQKLRLVPLPYPEDYDAALETWLVSGDAPDMWLAPLSPARIRQWIYNGDIRNLPSAVLLSCPRLSAVTDGDEMLQAYKTLYGGLIWYMPRVPDTNPVYAADGRRIFYRTDWLAQLDLSVPETTDDLQNLLRAARPYSSAVPMVTDSAAVFAYLFGQDPAQWVREEGRFVPAYYAREMYEPLAYARGLWEEGLLAFAGERYGGAADKSGAAVWVTEGGDAVSFRQALLPLAEALGATPGEVWARYAQVMAPPRAPGRKAVWGYANPTEGWVFRAGLNDEIIRRVIMLMENSLVEENRPYTRYGWPGVTYAADGEAIQVFTNPETFAAYDLSEMYPMGTSLLGMVTADDAREADPYFPLPAEWNLRQGSAESREKYYLPLNSEASALRKAADIPERDALSIDYEMYFYHIITSEEPLADVFERYQLRCREQGIEAAIEAAAAIISASAR